jgi:hypothetical protein
MNIDTQNKFSSEEEEFINRISDVLRRHEERKIIEKTVSDKIASTQFVAPKGFLSTSAGKVLVYGSLAAAAAVILFFVLIRTPDSNVAKDDLTFIPVEELAPPAFEQNEIINEDINAEKKIQRGTGGTGRKREALPGLPLSSREQKMMMKKAAQEFSFTKTYEFDAGNSMRRFRKDLKRELNKLGLKFTDKSNRDDIIYLISEKARAVSDDSRLVEYYIIAKVDKQYPGYLTMSLRYYEIEGESIPGYVKSVNTIFYKNIQARVGNLINWRYKPTKE